MMAGDYVRRSVAEFVGTFALIFIGAGSVIYGDIVGVALAHGLVIAVMVSAVGLISGGFFNPGITIGFLITRRLAPSLGAVYLVVQFAAAALAALLLRWVLPASARTGSHLGAPILGSGVSSGKGVAIEAVLTFFLVWAVFATAVDPRGTFKQIAGLAIGLTITIDVLMGGPLNGAAMNPARAFGPELLGNFWGEGWIYYLGPAIGALIAAVGYDYLYLRPPRPAVVGTPESGVAEPRPGDTALD